MSLKTMDHIGIAVRNAEETAKFYTEILGLQELGTETVPSMKLKIIKVRSKNVTLELFEPLPGEEVVSRFLQTKGEGLHHLCFEVSDLLKSTRELQDQGYSPLWDTPRRGSGQRLVQFLHPKQTQGVLIELCQKPPA